jgi:deoxyribodipyrimidine photolyase
VNDENLIPFSERSESEVRAMNSRGGKKSGETRRRKRDIKRALDALLEKDITAKNGETMTGAEAIALKLMEKALKGDVKAFEVLRDSAGQKPTSKLEVSGATDTFQEVMDMWNKNRTESE